MKTRSTVLIVAMVTGILTIAGTAPGENPTPGYNNKIPESIMTPDKVKTRIPSQRGRV